MTLQEWNHFSRLLGCLMLTYLFLKGQWKQAGWLVKKLHNCTHCLKPDAIVIAVNRKMEYDKKVLFQWRYSKNNHKFIRLHIHKIATALFFRASLCYLLELHVLQNGLKQSNNPNDNRWFFICIFFQNNIHWSGAVPLIFEPIQEALSVLCDLFGVFFMFWNLKLWVGGS